MWDFGFFLSPRLPAGKIPRVTPIVRNRACWEHEFCNGRKHWQKKKRQERKGPETAPWTVSITRLLWLRQWRTLFLAAIRSLCLLSSRGFSLSLASIRDGERNRTKGTSPIAPQRLPRLPRSPRLPPASFFFTHPPPCSSRQPSSLSTHKFTQPLHPDRNESVFKNASLFNFIISVALIFPDLIYILQLDWSVISM